jgi:hypothetical protein
MWIGDIDMMIPQEADLSWMLAKAALIVVSGLAVVLGVAWAGVNRLFPK